MWFFWVVMACLALSTPAWADGALALGCTSDGTIVWGYEFGESSVGAAAPIALKRCQAKGSDCTLWRAALHGDGAWVALALDPTVPAPRCLPWGGYYSESKETAAKMAMTACQRNGGHNCKISFLEQNKGKTTYYIVPGTNAPTGSSPSSTRRCWDAGAGLYHDYSGSLPMGCDPNR